MKLPEAFWKPQGAGRLQGGVELGLMSTTADRDIALQYSGAGDGKLATILEAESGRVDCGGRLGFLSQYPGEEEYLLGPYACLEVMGRPFHFTKMSFTCMPASSAPLVGCIPPTFQKKHKTVSQKGGHLTT